MSVHEHIIAATWLYSVLGANATIASLAPGRIYDTEAPEAAAHPLIVFQQQAGYDVRVRNRENRIFVSSIYLVKAIGLGRSYTGTLGTLASAIDTVLHGASEPDVMQGATKIGSIIAATRESPFQMPETAEGGATYRHLGGMYRLLIQQAT